jgi:NAD(P)-dependent dehydrogenase (short-subunit alcohol dehydrogenase family)
MSAGSATPMQDRYLAKTKPAYAALHAAGADLLSVGQAAVNTPDDLQGRCAIVTGAGKGLGRAYALHLAARGAKGAGEQPAPSGRGRRPDLGATDRGAIRAAGGTAVANWSDVTDPDSGSAMVTQAHDQLRWADIVVANAGVDNPTAFHKQSDGGFPRHLRHQLFRQPAPGTRRLAPSAGAGYGRMVLTASSAGLHANHGQVGLFRRQAAVIGLVRALAIEGRRHGVRVNAIAPYGYSQMTAPYMPATWVAFDPALVAPLVGWLCQRIGCDVTGEVLVSGGGLVRRAGVGETDARPLAAADVADDRARLACRARHCMAYASANDSFARFLQDVLPPSLHPHTP